MNLLINKVAYQNNDMKILPKVHYDVQSVQTVCATTTAV